jgi:hypothetical protein
MMSILQIRDIWTDEHIASKYSSLNSERLQEVKECIKIALECVDVSQKNRPPIAEIVERLDGKRVQGNTGIDRHRLFLSRCFAFATTKHTYYTV